MTEGFTPFYFGERVSDNVILRQQALDYVIKEQRHHEIMQFMYGIVFIFVFLLLFYCFKHRKKLFNIVYKMYNTIVSHYRSYTRIEKLLATIIICFIILIILIIIFILHFSDKIIYF